MTAPLEHPSLDFGGPMRAPPPPVPDRRPRRSRALAAAPFVVCLAAFAALNVVLPALANSTNSPLLGTFIFAHVFGQLSWLAVWFVMGPSRWAVRLLLALAAGTGLFGSFAIGMGSGRTPEPSATEILKALPMLPLALLATALPLLLLRAVTGWQIAFLGLGPAASPGATRRRFAVRDLFGATAFVAVSLASARLGLQWMLGDDGPLSDSDTRVFVLVFLPAFAGFSLVLACPSVWSSLGIRSLILGTVVVSAYATTVSALETWGLWSMTSVVVQKSGGRPDLDGLFGLLVLFNGAALLTVHGSLVLARKFGYGLLRKPRPGRPAEAPSHTTAETAR